MASSQHRIRIHAAPDAVFKALSTEDGMKRWFTANVEGVFGEGQIITQHFPKNQTFRWKCVAFEPPTTLKWECLEGPGAAKGTTATYDLKPEGAGDTVLCCVHEGWPNGHQDLATCNTLWGILFGRLRDSVEKHVSEPVFA